MKYLKIENVGTFDSEAFTLLGVSSARQSTNSATIGKFGSGSKMGVITLLRHNLSPIVFLGTTKLEFFTKPISVQTLDGNVDSQQVYVRVSGNGVRRTEKLGYTLDFGALDWSGVDMALREFVSNAIDAHVAQSIKDVPLVEWVEENQVRAKSGTTRVFVPFSHHVGYFKDQLPSRFKQFGGTFQESDAYSEEQVFEKGIIRECAIYRRGVFIGSDQMESLFDYNIETKLDESRNLERWRARADISRVLTHPDNAPYVKRILREIVQGGAKKYEFELESYVLENGNYKQLFHEEFGEDAVLTNEARLCDIIRKKGKKPIYLDNACWYAALRRSCPTHLDLLTQDDLLGRTIGEADSSTKESFDKVWDRLGRAQCLYGKEKPPVYLFEDSNQSGSLTCGFYRDSAIYLNKEVVGKSSLFTQTLIEEIGHYVSEADDYTRGFQNWLTLAVSNLMEG